VGAAHPNAKLVHKVFVRKFMNFAVYLTVCEQRQFYRFSLITLIFKVLETPLFSDLSNVKYLLFFSIWKASIMAVSVTLGSYV